MRSDPRPYLSVPCSDPSCARRDPASVPHSRRLGTRPRAASWSCLNGLLALGLALLRSASAQAVPATDDETGFSADEVRRLVAQGPNADAEQVARLRAAAFQRNLRFWPDQDARLQRTIVAVAGATTEVGWLSAELLTRLGVGTLRLSELGQSEVAITLAQPAPARGSIDALIAHLGQLNPTLRIEVADESGAQALAGFAQGASVVLDALPTGAPAARWALHHAAQLRRAPVIVGQPLGDGARLARFEPGGPTYVELMGLNPSDDDKTQIARTAAGPQPAALAYYLATPASRAVIANAALQPSALPAVGMAAALLTDAAMARVLGLPGLPAVPHLTYLDPATASFRSGRTLSPRLWMHDKTLTQASAEDWARLANKGIGVFGAGAVGGWAAWILARTTAQLAPEVPWRLRLVDGDSFDWPNLQRQTGATLATIGKPKVEVLATLLADAGGRALTLDARHEMLTAENAAALLEGLDALIPAVDVFAEPARHALCEAAYYRGLPFFDRAPLGRGSAGGTFRPGDGPWSTLTGIDPTRMDDFEMLARHLLVVAGGPGAHLRYMLRPEVKPQLDLRHGRAPSLASACVLSAALTSHAALASLLGLPTSRALTQVDPFLGGKTRSYPISSNATLWRRALLAALRYRGR